MPAKRHGRLRFQKGSARGTDRKKIGVHGNDLAATTQPGLPLNAAFAFGKISKAVYLLATEPGDVRSRLRSAYLPLAFVHRDMIPTELRPHFEWVMAMLTRRQPRFPWEDSLDTTLGSMQNRTGTRIAERIMYIEARYRDIIAASTAESPIPAHVK
jgi:hypothetical protein